MVEPRGRRGPGVRGGGESGGVGPVRRGREEDELLRRAGVQEPDAAAGVLSVVRTRREHGGALCLQQHGL